MGFTKTLMGITYIVSFICITMDGYSSVQSYSGAKIVVVISATRVSPGCGCCSMKGAVVAAVSTLVGCHWPIHFWGRPQQGLCEGNCSQVFLVYHGVITALSTSLDLIEHPL